MPPLALIRVIWGLTTETHKKEEEKAEDRDFTKGPKQELQGEKNELKWVCGSMKWKNNQSDIDCDLKWTKEKIYQNHCEWARIDSNHSVCQLQENSILSRKFWKSEAGWGWAGQYLKGREGLSGKRSASVGCLRIRGPSRGVPSHEGITATWKLEKPTECP